jgi:hypothetical protein
MDEESTACIYPYWELETGQIIEDAARLFELFLN